MIRRKAFNILTALSGLFHSRGLAGSQAGRIIQFSVEADGCRYSLWMWDTIIYAFSARRTFTNEYIDIQQRDLCDECERLVTEAVCQCCAVYYIITQLHHWNFAVSIFVFFRDPLCFIMISLVIMSHWPVLMFLGGHSLPAYLLRFFGLRWVLPVTKSTSWSTDTFRNQVCLNSYLL